MFEKQSEQRNMHPTGQASQTLQICHSLWFCLRQLIRQRLPNDRAGSQNSYRQRYSPTQQQQLARIVSNLLGILAGSLHTTVSRAVSGFCRGFQFPVAGRTIVVVAAAAAAAAVAAAAKAGSNQID